MAIANAFKTSTHMRMRTTAALLAGSALALIGAPALAQDAQGEATMDTIVVTGIRAVIQNSIDVKRQSTTVVEALTSEEIGDIPALSIGEALETLTSAASHREQGGATEISIRGLGPFLGSTVVNGRAASNGSGDRSVNFSQFPSELFNKIAVYKTQEASFIEGGVAGQIALDTVKPLDFGKRRIQGEFKLNYNPDNMDIASDQRLQDLGYRGTLSYVDQFNVGEGRVGISLGYSRSVTTNPEQEASVSNTLNYCKNDPTDRSSGVFDDGNCNSSITQGEDFVIAQNSYSYRQNITDDTRDSFFAALQFQPNSDIDINIDFQYSKRLFREKRNDLNFSEGRRVDGAGDANRLDYDLIVGPNGELLQFTGETSIETNSEYLERDEKYYGGGLDFAYQVTDRLKLSADVSYSETQRIEEATQVRMRIRDGRDIFGNTGLYPVARESDNSNTDDRVETAYLIRQNGSDIFNFVVQDFDVNNHDLYRDSARARYDLEQDRFNSIFAARGDVEYELGGFFSSVESGIRFQKLKYRDVPGAANGTSRFENTYSNAALAIANQACRTEFPESGFLSSVTNGNPLVTVVDAAGNVTSTTNTFATFDALCLARTLEENDPTGEITFDEDGIPIYPDGSFESIQNNDVREDTWAGYVQANFIGEMGAIPYRGNLGLRVIRTKVASTGFRTTLSSITNGDGSISLVEDTGNLVSDTVRSSYTEFLPSFNFVADVAPDVLARFAAYRALSRPDPSALGNGRAFSIDSDGEFGSVTEALGVVTALGNPSTEPLLSWNLDAALEWYPNKDTILAGGVYFKSFNGGFETTSVTETFVVDGVPNDAIVSLSNTTGDSSTIYGFEVTASHRFSYLPRPFDGLGFKLSYNYADSNFEFEDDTLGATIRVNSDGSLTEIPGVIPPAGIFGLSKHVMSAQVYYQIGNLDIQGVYKYRSRYFQQFIATPGRVRYVDNTGVFEARISYALTKNIKFSLEGLNLFSEPRTDLRGTEDNLGAVSAYGPRFFAGIRAKF